MRNGLEYENKSNGKTAHRQIDALPATTALAASNESSLARFEGSEKWEYLIIHFKAAVSRRFQFIRNR